MTSSVTTKSDPDIDAERDEVLAAAARIFASTGVLSSSLEHVASEAGCGRSAVLRHFATKRELVVVYVQRWAKERRAEAEAVRARHSGDPRAVLMACATLLEQPSSAMPGRSWVHFAAELPREHPVRHLVVELRRWYLGFLAEQLRLLGKRDADGVAAALLMFHTGAMTATALEGATRADAAQARRLYALLIDGPE